MLRQEYVAHKKHIRTQIVSMYDVLVLLLLLLLGKPIGSL